MQRGKTMNDYLEAHDVSCKTFMFRLCALILSSHATDRDALSKFYRVELLKFTQTVAHPSHKCYRGKKSPTIGHDFYRATVCNATHGIAKACPSVRLSVRPR